MTPPLLKAQRVPAWAADAWKRSIPFLSVGGHEKLPVGGHETAR